jgi:hypothetical protein
MLADNYEARPLTLLESVNSLVKQHWLVFCGLVSISVSMTPMYDSAAANPTAAEENLIQSRAAVRRGGCSARATGPLSIRN